MNGRDFLISARRLEAGLDEPDWRSAVSRAYYSAFHAARDLLAQLRFQTPRADRAHNFVYVRLNNSDEPNSQDAASLLNDLRRRRNEADYDMRLRFRAGDAAKSILDAEQVHRVFDNLSAADRTQISDAIKIHEQQIGDVTWRP